MKNIIVLTGAGISAESGIKTFRDSDGLWENHDVMDVASIDGWLRNPELVLNFYNQRRRQLKEVAPNAAHKALVDLEQNYTVHIITQNVDDLHERAGSSKIIHLHGELRKVRSSTNAKLVHHTEEDIHLGDLCKLGSQLRPHIVWFGEEVPLLGEAARLTSMANVVLIIGTSMQVYPAASLVGYAPASASIFYIDPRPAISYELERAKNLQVIAAPASIGVPQLVDQLLSRESA